MKTGTTLTYFICLILIISSQLAYAWPEKSELMHIGPRTMPSDLLPANGQKPPPVIYSSNGSNKYFFALGDAAVGLAKSFVAEDERDMHPVLRFNDVYFVRDHNQNRIAAIYPLIPLKDIYVTALHVLKNATVDPALLNYRMVGFINEKTNSLYDLAVFVKDDEALRIFINVASNNSNQYENVTIDHLNLVDQDDLMITRSHAKILAASPDYLYFNLSDRSLVGPSSSGSIVYNQKLGWPVGVVVCLSSVENEVHTKLIRSLRLGVIGAAPKVELTPDLIQAFQPLNCKNYDGRRGGGD